MIHTLIIIAIAIAIFAFGMGLGAWLENVRLTSIHAEDNLMQRITHEFEVQKETIWGIPDPNPAQVGPLAGPARPYGFK